jgi:tetratricopeptide (TPR) repeat protein
LENERVVEAVYALITRMALTRLHFGEDSERAIRAQITVAKAYLELRQLPRQALQHAEHARAVLRRSKDRHAVSPASLAVLEASVKLMLGTAQVAVATLPGPKGGRKGKRPASKRQPGAAAPAAVGRSTGSRRSTAFGKDVVGGPATQLTPKEKLLGKAERNLAAAAAACAEHPADPATTELAVQVNVSSAAMHRHRREFDAAATCLNAALATLGRMPESAPDPDQRAVQLRRELAAVEAARGEHGTAAECLVEALGEAEPEYGQHAPGLASHLLRIARAHMEDGDDAAASGPLAKAVRLLEAAIGVDPAVLKDQLICGVNDDVPFLAEWLEATDETIKLHIRLAEYREALERIRLVTPIKAELFGPKSAEVASVEYLHGNILLALEKTESAVKRITKARDLWIVAFSPKHKRVAEADQLLAAIKAGEAAAGRGRHKGSPTKTFK